MTPVKSVSLGKGTKIISYSAQNGIIYEEFLRSLLFLLVLRRALARSTVMFFPDYKIIIRNAWRFGFFFVSLPTDCENISDM